MNRCLTLLFLFIFLAYTGKAQVFRYRLGANSSLFLTELFPKEIPAPGNYRHPGSSKFESELKPGLELEFIAPYSRTLELGVQLGYNHYAGYTPTALFHNFFLSKFNPARNKNFYPDEALIYDSYVLKIMGTSRWYIISINKELNLYMKYFAGVAFTGTDFTFANPVDRIKYDVGVLYSRGTKNSEYPKIPGITGGTGIGTAYRLSDRIDINFEVTASLIYSDLVNGIPNYDYIQIGDKGQMKPVNALSAALEGSLGIVFSAIPDRRMSKSNFTRSTKLNKNKFLKSKSKRKFSKHRRR